MNEEERSTCFVETRNAYLCTYTRSEAYPCETPIQETYGVIHAPPVGTRHAA